MRATGMNSLNRVGALRQGRAGEAQRTAAHHVRGPVAAREAAAGQADLAQHGGQRDQRPERLLAVVRALQRPADADHGAPRRHLARQRNDAVGGNAGDPLRPGRVLGLAVLFAAEIAAELLEADRVAVEEGLIVEALDQQRVAEREDHRGVGVGPDRQPFDIAARVEIVGRRRHIDEAHAGLAQAEQAAPDAWTVAPPALIWPFLRGTPPKETKSSQCLASTSQLVWLGQQLLKRSHDMRHQHERSADAVIILVAHEPADRIEEAP